jgi:hypothetical protein
MILTESSRNEALRMLEKAKGHVSAALKIKE